MVTELITEKSAHIRNWMWKQRLEHAYFDYSGLIGDTKQMHFIFGLKGSGVDHLARLLVQPGANLRYFNNPLARFEPRLVLSGSGDRLATPFSKELARDHPMLRVYRMLVEYDTDWGALRMGNRAHTKHPEQLPTLVKEQHGLLSIEAILRDFGAKTLLYVGDPVKTVDSLLQEEGLESPYLMEEGRSVLAPYFLARFLRRDYSRVMHAYRKISRLTDNRRRIILHRILVAALIQHMFRMLSARYPELVVLAEYDRLLESPVLLEDLAENLLGEAGIAIGRSASVGATFKPATSDQLIWKSAWPEQAPVTNFLSAEEVRAGYKVLQDSGLQTRIPDQSRYRPLVSRGSRTA